MVFRTNSNGLYIKWLLSCLITLLNSDLHGQFNHDQFLKVPIEVSGDEVNTVRDIVQDKNGYLWIASELGLLRYDGYEALRFDESLTLAPSMNFGSIECLLLDSEGNLWIGQEGVHKLIVETQSFEHFENENAPSSIVDMKEDGFGNIWFAMQEGGVFKFDKKSKTFTRVLNDSSLPVYVGKDVIRRLLIDSQNNLWIGTGFGPPSHGSGLIKYNIASGKAQRFLHEPNNRESLSDNRISSIYEDKDGNILIGTFRSGLNIYNSKTNSFRRLTASSNSPINIYPPKNEDAFWGNDAFVNIIHQDKRGDYWIGTTGKGINHFATETGDLRFYSSEIKNSKNKISNQVWSLKEDAQGKVWLGDMSSGLYVFDPNKKKITLNDEFKTVRRIYEPEKFKGSLWISSSENGFGTINLENNHVRTYLYDSANPNGLGNVMVQDFFQENENTVWLALGSESLRGRAVDGKGGLDKFNINQQSFNHIKLQKEPNGINHSAHKICQDSSGTLWIAAGSGGLFRSNNNKAVFDPVSISSTESDSLDPLIFFVDSDGKGNIWIGNYQNQGNLLLFSPKTKKIENILKGHKVSQVINASNGNLLIATLEKGLLVLDETYHIIKAYNTKNGLESNFAISISKESDSLFWIGSMKGPSVLNIKTGNIHSAGLPKTSFSSNIVKASNGKVFQGSIKGFVSFYPSQISEKRIMPKVRIQQYVINDSIYRINRKGTPFLKHSQNDISFEFVGLHYTDPNKSEYQYKLEPVDKTFKNGGTNRLARFSNLAPDNYTFKVKASNSDGVWSEVQSFDFVIKTAPWRSWWAYLLYFIAVASLIYFYYQFQIQRKLALAEVKKLKEIHALKNGIYTNITHEFRTPLTVIQGMTSSLKSDILEKKDAAIQKSINMIERNSQGLLNLVNDMLDLAKIENQGLKLSYIQSDVIAYIKYVAESFSSMAQDQGLSLTVYSEVDELLMDFDSQRLSSVISNLLANAIKFSKPGSKIIVHVHPFQNDSNKDLGVKIKDEGIGISEEELPHIFSRFYRVNDTIYKENEGTGIGLALSKELIELMGGTINASSVLGKGSTFSFTIPVTNNAPLSHSFEPLLKQNYIAPQNSFSNNFQDLNNSLPLVLIIEDNMDVVHYLEKCLQESYAIIHAKNGEIGIRIALEKIPDVIISDVMMPVKSGFEVCETLKTNELTDHIPIILLTAKATVKDRLDGLSKGADAYLAKPFLKEELFTRMQQLIQLREKIIAKFQENNFNQIAKKRTSNPETVFLQKAINGIFEEISNHGFGSVQLAQTLNLSDSQVYRKLKAITGKSTALFIRSVRLQKAKELLENSNLTVSEVAYDVGFNDPAWFSRAFKEEFGFAPSSIHK